jgi:hypothetical protein
VRINMATSYTYTKELGCCDGLEVQVKRTILRKLDDTIPSGLIRHARASDETIGEYKALSHRNGNTRQYDISVTTKAGLVGSGSRLGQAAQAAGSIITPGNISRVRSPLRSAGWRAITPGLPGGGRGIRKRGRAHRCPEGYQYGGRFTDNQLSTCGQQLFDIPSAIGATIAAIRRAAAGAPAGPEGEVIRGRSGQDVLKSRRPDIPRVGNDDRQERIRATGKIIEAMGKPDINTARLVRRDGFQLEPVVSPAVLRTIPDNRDMEGATYLMNLTSVDGMGGEELGLLSNTGVTNISYVLPDGSSLSIEKVRGLTVGERRKLGRTVNAAMKKDNSKDPAARLKFVDEETGTGIAYTEDWKGSARSVADALKSKPDKTPTVEAEVPEAEVPEGVGDKIGNVDDAVTHINGGGSLAEIDPSILQAAMRKAGTKRPGGIFEVGDNRYLMQSSKTDFDHLHVATAAEIQNHLGLAAFPPAFTGKGGKRRGYVLAAPSMDTDRTFDDVDPEDAVRMLLSDLILGVNDRPPTAVGKLGEATVPTHIPSALKDLDDISIQERIEESISSMKPLSNESIYSSHYQQLREAQQEAFRNELERLLERARTFNFTDYKDRLYRDGALSAAEKTHLNIIQTIVEARIQTLAAAYNAILARLDGSQ